MDADSLERDNKRAMALAIFLAENADKLASDLEWTLNELEQIKRHIPEDEEKAKRWLECHNRLKFWKNYQAARNKVDQINKFGTVPS